MTSMPRSIRVFISYSHKDEELVQGLSRVLRENGLTVMRDKNFAYGVGFPDQIKKFIEYAHVFMPVITRKSSRRGWVHQEIGYAMAQNVPVLPVSVDSTPGEWLQTVHSIMLNRKDLLHGSKKLATIFSPFLIRDLVDRYRDDRFASYNCGQLHEDRTEMMTDYANDVARIQSLIPAAAVEKSRESALSSFVRQKGALSSFHIPDEPIHSDVWVQRYAADNQKSEHHRQLQRNERIALTAHAKRWGCRLIVNPRFKYKTDEMTQVRLNCLLNFLRSEDGRNAEVAINTKMRDHEHRMILGNWFLADTVAAVAKSGYYQTIFTRHAPSMEARIEQFDDEFFRLLDEADCEAYESREFAIAEITKVLDRIRAAPTRRPNGRTRRQER